MPIIEGPNSEGAIHCGNEQLFSDRSAGSTIAHRTLQFLTVVDQLVQQVTIGILPDDVLLKLFKLFVDAKELYQTESDTADVRHTLVHVCQRWRYLAFSPPRHLDLQLLCKIPWRSVNEMLDIWPQLPIYIYAMGYLVIEKESIAALRLNHRVSGIRFRGLHGKHLHH